MQLKRVVNGFNRWFAGLRTAPGIGRFVSKHFTDITYTGRRSGRTFSTPVGYRRTGDQVLIAVLLPDAKAWWRNFTGDGNPISIVLDGADRTGHAIARRASKRRVIVTVQLAA
ncbi:DUF385 domain-containing protein [Kribbella antibiotica]|uniref:DUF385 domain-containing protein n=1 Tax=Kribbella antibiotica TaxID=190195 RepID=A0A4R4YIV8_9ACTN|nr:nitroreductase/quinone reductase family protein [Kribbella antibiotica]TDD44746.1 DUF385 domain-containing protein [Kribbella antibiotica]